MLESTRPHRNIVKMILWLLILPLILVPTAGKTSAPSHRVGAAGQSARVVAGYGKLPLVFEPNQGQTDPEVKFLSRGAAYGLFLTANQATLTLSDASQKALTSFATKSLVSHDQLARQKKASVLRIKLLGANVKVRVTGQDQLPGKSNYFLGKDRKKWHVNIPQYAKVHYANVYPGVDLVYYGKQRALECDFVVQPGVDPSVIRLGIEGAQNIRLERGDLLLRSAGRDVHLRAPMLYQETNGIRNEVRGGYVMRSGNEVGFSISAYDRKKALIIDPVLAYSTYLGGGNPVGNPGEMGNAIAVDLSGNAYVTGYTISADFPTAHPYQQILRGCCDAFVTKINPEGSGLIYSTYLGGGPADWGEGIAVDAAGNAYVTGITYSADFPVVNAIEPIAPIASNAFVTKINSDGNALVYSTYLGGNGADAGYAIALDPATNAYVAGWTTSNDFPTANAIQPNNHGGSDAFVTKINAGGSAFVYSTYVGGSANEASDSYVPYRGIAVDASGNAYVTGSTESTDFPVVNAIQPFNAGGSDVFVTKINAGGSALGYSTYLGSSGNDLGDGVAADSSGNAYLAWNNRGSGGGAFVTKITSDGSALVYNTLLGPGTLSGIAVDTAGNAYVTGGAGAGFPTINAIQPSNHGGADAIVVKINASGAVLYSTFLGGTSDDDGSGIAVDAAGSAYIVGSTWSRTLPKTDFAFQPLRKGRNDAFVAKIASQSFVSALPAKLSFARQVIGTPSAAKKIVVTNQGINALVINRIQVAGRNASEYAETNNCPGTLPAAGSCTVWITFTPLAKNARTAVLGISDSDAASPQVVSMTGPGTVVSLSAIYLGFGKQAVGTNSIPRAVTLMNVGNTQLNFTSISITGANASDYSQTNTCGTSIAAAANCTVTVTFKPTVFGIRKAAVTISNDGGGSPQKITLAGTGI